MRGRPRAGAGRRRELLALLLGLSKPGATLVKIADSSERGVVPVLALITRDDPDGRFAPIDRSLLDTVCTRGWVNLAGDGTRAVVTRAGRELLRRARSEGFVGSGQPLRAGQSNERAGPQTNAMECPLGWLAGRRDPSGRPLLEPEEVAAGERLRADLTFAGLGPRMTMSWSGLPSDRGAVGASGHGRDLSDGVLAARQRVAKALRKVGPEFSGLLIDVCGHYRGLADVAEAEGWPQRAARLLLQKALRTLARHYGLLPDVSVEQTITARLRHWGSEDYRPTLTRPGPAPDQDL